MKRLVSILLLLSLCSQYFIQTGFVSWFELNKDIIAKTLCINKDQPEMHCDGKCFLKKGLNKIENRSNAKSQRIKAEQNTFIQPQAIEEIHPFPSIIKKQFVSTENPYSFLLANSLLRPPQIL